MRRGGGCKERVTREGLARWRGEASCISQICRVIKLIKRLTHGGLVLLSVSPPPPLFRVSFAPALAPQALPRAVSLSISVPLIVRYHRFAVWQSSGLTREREREKGERGGEGEAMGARMIETRRRGGSESARSRERGKTASSPAPQIIVITEYYAAVSAVQTPWPIKCGYVPNMVNLNFQRPLRVRRPRLLDCEKRGTREED